MLSSFVITLREGLEAALIVALVLAAVRKAGAVRLVRSVWFGVGAGAGLSLAAGLVLTLTLGSLPEHVEEIFAGVASLLAVAVLTFMVFWMRSHSGEMAKDLDHRVAGAAGIGSGWAVGTLAFAAVAREGLETALMLFGSFGSSTAVAAGVGSIAGLVVAIVLGYGLNRGTVHLDLRKFFWATGAVLVIFGAGLLATGLHELQEAGILPTLVQPVWNMNGVLDESAGVGAFLKGLVGYNGAPSLVEVVAYWVYLGVAGYLFVRPRHVKPAPGATTVQAGSGSARAVTH